MFTFKSKLMQTFFIVALTASYQITSTAQAPLNEPIFNGTLPQQANATFTGSESSSSANANTLSAKIVTTTLSGLIGGLLGVTIAKPIIEQVIATANSIDQDGISENSNYALINSLSAISLKLIPAHLRDSKHLAVGTIIVGAMLGSIIGWTVANLDEYSAPTTSSSSGSEN